MFSYRVARVIPVHEILRVQEEVGCYFNSRNDPGVRVTASLVTEELGNSTVEETVDRLTSAIDYERSIARQRQKMDASDGGSVNPLGTLSDDPCHPAAVGAWRELRRQSRPPPEVASYEPI